MSLGMLRSLLSIGDRVKRRLFNVNVSNPLEVPIPENLDEAVKAHPHLQDYLSKLKSKPAYAKRLNLADSFSLQNVIYPVGQGIFIHVNLTGGERRYNVIEPARPPPWMLEKIETWIARVIADKGIEFEESEKAKIIISCFNEALKKSKIKLGKADRDRLLYHLLREKIGHGFLDPFLLDEWLEDIGIPGAGPIFVYHRIYGYLESNRSISKDDIDKLLRSIAERYGKVLSYANPIIDIHLPDGSRLNVVFGEDISLRGSNFTIRKFAKEPISVAHLVRWNTLTAEMAAYMWMLIDVGISFFVCGETASGKTTTLNALTAFIKPDSKIVSIEETPEVRLPHKNWVREVTRLHTGSPVTMFDLVKAALRQRPDYIIIGEIRGEEGRVAFQAIATGHPVISTMHAGHLGQLFQRLTSDPINVPKTQIDGLNLTIFQARIERHGKFIRRVTSVNEILGFNANTGRLMFLPSFLYDADEDKLHFIGSSFLLETKVLPFRGWGKDRLNELYDEINMRAAIIEFLAKKHPSYFDVFRAVIEVERRGLDVVYRRVKAGKAPWEG
ncbi:MAG: flagellar protein FlaI [Candidatus Methanomethylicota archaeon]|nr:MAG: flagellar protein FlaI [Candidatus Verstraetearchaeota archaeon]